MSQEFDPYLEWLGIAKDEPRPHNYYRLLGVEKFESDANLISLQANKLVQQLRTYSKGPHGELAEQLINEVTKAKLVLLKQDRREAYNRTLLAPQKSLAQPSPAPSPQPLARPVELASTKARVELASDPAQWDLDALPPMVPVSPGPQTQPDPQGIPALQTLPAAAAPVQVMPAYPVVPVVYPVPYQPYPQFPVTPPLVVSQPPLVPPPVVPPPLVYYPPMPRLPVVPPPSYLPRQLVEPAPHLALPPVLHGIPSRLLVSKEQPGNSSASPNDELSFVTQRLRVWLDSLRQRRVLRSVALSGALALVVMGTVVGIVVSKYGLNPSPSEPAADNPKPDAESKVPPPAPEPPANPSNEQEPASQPDIEIEPEQQPAQAV